MKNVIAKGAAFVVAVGLFGLAGSGCGGHWYSTVSTHTVSTGPDTEIDVVWLEDNNGQVYRCAPSASGPACQRPQGLR